MNASVTPPRYNEPGQALFVTVQAVSRSMRFLPRRDVRRSIDYLFALLVAKYGLLVHEFLWMSNHLHMVATDPDGRISAFLREFDSRLSRQLNAIRGQTGINFDRDPGIQRIADGAGIVKQALYTLTNPIAARLVRRLPEWKGCSSLRMRYGQTLTFARPKVGLWAETRGPKRAGKHASRRRLAYRGRSKAPATVSFTLARPRVELHKSDDALRDDVLAQAEARAVEIRRELRRAGKSKVLGWRGVMGQSFRDVAKTPRVLFERRPRVAGVDKDACAALAKKIVKFEKEYRAAVVDFATDRSRVFPFGTLQMVERYAVQCATAPP